MSNQKKVNAESTHNINLMTQVPEQSNYNPPKDIINNFHNVNKIKHSPKVNKDDTLRFFEESNMNYLKVNPEFNTDYEKIINENITFTKVEDQLNYWNQLKDIIANIQKTNTKYPYPELKFGKYLEDLEFLELFKKTIDYACYSLNEEELKEIKENLSIIESFTENIFSCPKVLKDLKEDSLLSYILADKIGEKQDNLELLKVTTCSLVPLIELKFTKDNKNCDLNREELRDILTSNILLHYFKNNLNNFIPELNKKIPKDNDLKKYINLYLDNYNIYFADLPENIHAMTIHTGDIFIQSKYIIEYYENQMFYKKEDDYIIIREKIILNIIHEMNHVLLRLIDEDKNKNFFLKSKNSDSKKKILLFKDKYNENIQYPLTGNESGNNFDHDFYKGYSFETLFKHEANFFADIVNIKDEKVYDFEFKKMITETKSKMPIETSINKFKKKFVFPRCSRSKFLGVIIKDE